MESNNNRDKVGDLLFDPEILGTLKLSSLPKEVKFDPQIKDLTRPCGVDGSLVVRPLGRGDFQKGFPIVLEGLTSVGDVKEDQFQETFDKLKKCEGMYYVTVIEDTSTGRIIGSATLLMEQKFIHNCALRGRIEDVVVNDEYRGQQLGKLLLSVLVLLSKELGCYKLSLDCKDNMIPFYEGFGFLKEPGNGNFMSMRF